MLNKKLRISLEKNNNFTKPPDEDNLWAMTPITVNEYFIIYFYNAFFGKEFTRP